MIPSSTYILIHQTGLPNSTVTKDDHLVVAERQQLTNTCILLGRSTLSKTFFLEAMLTDCSYVMKSMNYNG